MSAFDPVPQYRVARPGENATLALDMPLSPLHNLWEQSQQGALDTFGLGGVAKDLQTPRGVPLVDNSIEQALRSNPLTSGLAAGYEAARSLGLIGTPTTGAPMSSDDYKASPYFRKDIPWDAAMTTDRAASLAAQYDLRQARQYFGSKDIVTTLLGGFAGGAIDPLNFVPIFGPAARTAAAARWGYIAGHALIGASEAAINTAVFGALTAPDRARYGEDVSWEAAINNVVFSALAGGIFGGIGGAFDQARSTRAMKAEQAIKFGAETLRNAQEMRAVLNDGVGSMIETGDVRLTGASKSVWERIAAEVTDKRLAARALDDETRGVVGDKPGEVVITPSGAKVQVRAEVVDASTLQRATGALQVRDRSPENFASQQQVEQIATGLDPARLMPNIDGSQGAPIVGGDNVVDSGNGRVAAINRAYDAYPDKAAAYKQALVDAGHPEAAGMERPVLIQRRLTPLSDTARGQFNADLNGSTTARMSAVELAAMDRGALTDQTLEVLASGSDITSRDNRGFVGRFLGNLPSNERLALVDRAGNLSADGVRRIQNALVAAAYGDVDATALRKFAEATDDNTRAIVGALSDSAGDWLRLRRAVARGEVAPEFDQTPELTEALRRLGGWRDQAAREKRPVGTVIREGLGQTDIFAGSTAPTVKLFVRSFYADNGFTRAAGREVIAARLADLVDASIKAGQPDMLGDAYAATKLGVLKGVYNDLGSDIFETSGVPDGTGSISETGGGLGTGVDQRGDQPGVGANAGYRTPITAAESVRTVTDLKATQPARSLDELYAAAPEHQAALDEVGRAVSGADSQPVTGFTTAKGSTYEVHDGGASTTRTKSLHPEHGVEDQGLKERSVRTIYTDGPASDLSSSGLTGVDRSGKVGPPSTRVIINDADGKAVRFTWNWVTKKWVQASDLVPFHTEPGVGRYPLEVWQPADDVPASAGQGFRGMHAGNQITDVQRAAAKGGIEWKNPGLKDKATAAEKMARKGYESTSELTDVVRGGFVVHTPEAADAVVTALARKFPTVVDEGWRISAAGYFDRKVLVQFHDGTIGEVQFWHPKMLEAKAREGHKIYEEMRGLKPDDPKFAELLDRQKELYLATVADASEDWLPVISRLVSELEAGGRPAHGNASSNAISDNSTPESMISATSDTGRQSALDNGLNQPELPLITAGRSSQSKNVGFMGRDVISPTVDMQEARPIPPPDGLDAAAARVGKPDDVKAISEQFGVDPKTGEFSEMADIEDMRRNHQVTAEDEAELAAADKLYSDAEAYGEMLRAATNCVVG